MAISPQKRPRVTCCHISFFPSQKKTYCLRSSAALFWHFWWIDIFWRTSQGQQCGTSHRTGRGSGRARGFLGPTLEFRGLWHCDPLGLEARGGWLGVSETSYSHHVRHFQGETNEALDFGGTFFRRSNLAQRNGETRGNMGRSRDFKWQDWGEDERTEKDQEEFKKARKNWNRWVLNIY